MTADLRVVAALALLTGLLLTAHVLIVAGLFARRALWPALVALSVPPMAPILAYRVGLHARASIWVGAALAYVAIRLSFWA